jgi:predicted phosphodiesterase
MINVLKIKSMAFAWIIFLGFSSCNLSKPIIPKRHTDWQSHMPPAGAPVYSLFLSGDGGEPLPDGTDPYLRELRKSLNARDTNSAVIFLGDNVYPSGLPSEADPDRKKYEKVLDDQIQTYSDFKGKVFWIAGNHDWDEGHPEGLDKRLNQELYIEAKSGRGNIYFPDGGCPGPTAIALNENLVLLVMDTQWWLHQYEKPRDKSLCGVTTEEELIHALRAEFAKHAGKTIFVAAHHPMETCGPHGGKFPLRSHVFPLLEFNRKLWIPLPILGGIYVFARKSVKYVQDTPNKHYRRMRIAFQKIFEEYPGTVYVNGHDHSLQLIRKNKVNYITSGSASHISHVVRKKYLDFGLAGNGFVVVNIYSNGEKWAEFISVNAQGSTMIYRQKLD